MMATACIVSSAELFDDPYPFYAYLRHHRPVHFYEPIGEWFVTRWGDCQTIGANPDVFGPSDGFMPMVKRIGVPKVLTIRFDEHRCLREGIDAPLQQAAVDGYVDAWACPIICKVLATLRDRGSADLTTELFEPISVRRVADIMGLRAVNIPTLVRWFQALNAGAQNVDDEPKIWGIFDGVKTEIKTAVEAIYSAIVRNPDNSLISHIIHGGMPEGHVRPLAEIMPTLRVIILGGLQEPGHGAANAHLGPLAHPEQARAVVDDPARLALKAYDEGLRWIAPIGVAARRATRDATLGGIPIPAGERVAVIVGPANRAAWRRDSPNDFRLERPRKANASFGYRPHFCSGHYLSRNIGRTALGESFASLPSLRLDTERPVWTKGWRFRGVVNLSAQWDALGRSV